jgi:heme-degrading monooxygenase HmoA
MAEHATVVDVSRYYPADGKRDGLLEAMRKLAQTVSQAPGCFGSQVCTSDTDGDALIAVSRWESAEALQRFADSSEFAAERDGLSDLLGRRSAREHLTSA